MPEKQDAIEEEKGPGIDDYENTQLKRVIKVLDDLEKGGKQEEGFPAAFVHGLLRRGVLVHDAVAARCGQTDGTSVHQ